MNQSLAKKTKEILNKHNIILNKNLGQNYLIDNNKKNQIIKFGELSKEDTVLEIGSGIGTLTIDLSLQSKKVIAIEQDKTIFKILEERIENKNIANVELINKDALSIDFPKFNKIVSNLPYQISSPITFKFLDYDFDLAILMYQQEFAKRMNGKVGSKDYSRLSAMLYFKCDVEFLTEVSSESFIPKPKVNSSVIKLTPKNLEMKKDDFLTYSKFTKALFQHRNKKVKNALIDSRHEITKIDKKELKNKLNDIRSAEINELISKRVINIHPKDIFSLSIYLNNLL